MTAHILDAGLLFLMWRELLSMFLKKQALLIFLSFLSSILDAAHFVEIKMMVWGECRRSCFRMVLSGCQMIK